LWLLYLATVVSIFETNLRQTFMKPVVLTLNLKKLFTWRAHALVVRAAVDASGAILAGFGGTGVILELATDAGVGRGAGAVDVRAEVTAEAAVEAGAADAPFRGGLATFAVSSLGADAEVVL
jgi:hypothetical protein